MPHEKVEIVLSSIEHCHLLEHHGREFNSLPPLSSHSIISLFSKPFYFYFYCPLLFTSSSTTSSVGRKERERKSIHSTMLKLKSFNTRDALRAAATKGCLEAVHFFVEEGVDKDAADKEGKTPVMLASQNNHQAVVQFLEEFKTDKKKADMSLKKKSLDTRDALRAAVNKGCLEAVRFLVEEKVCQDENDYADQTLWMLAIQAGHTAVARYLV